MNSHCPTQDDRLLVALQKGLPLTSQPFRVMADRLGVEEEKILAYIEELFAAALARRLGGIFDAASLGYQSTICAVNAESAEDLSKASDFICARPEVSHCYRRDGIPNIWFTVTAPQAEIDTSLKELADALAPARIYNFPAQRRYKVQVIFQSPAQSYPQNNKTDTATPDTSLSTGTMVSRKTNFSDSDKALVRALQKSITITSAPYAEIAEQLNMNETEIIATMQSWQKQGILRRVGLIIHHRRAGFLGNGMCVWKVAENKLDEKGEWLAKHRQVTHCYARLPEEGFDYNLFAMIHHPTPEEALRDFAHISEEGNLPDGRLLLSTTEYKKTSMQFFTDSTEDGSS